MWRKNNVYYPSFSIMKVASGPFIALQDRANATAFEKICRDIFGEDVTPENPESAGM